MEGSTVEHMGDALTGEEIMPSKELEKKMKTHVEKIHYQKSWCDKNIIRIWYIWNRKMLDWHISSESGDILVKWACSLVKKAETMEISDMVPVQHLRLEFVHDPKQDLRKNNKCFHELGLQGKKIAVWDLREKSMTISKWAEMNKFTLLMLNNNT